MSVTVVGAPVVGAPWDGRISEDRLRALGRKLREPGQRFSVSAVSGWDVQAPQGCRLVRECTQEVGGPVWASDLMAFIRANWGVLRKPGAVLVGWRVRAADGSTGSAFLGVRGPRDLLGG